MLNLLGTKHSIFLLKGERLFPKKQSLSCLFYMATSSSARQFLCVLRAIKTSFTWTPSDAIKWYVAAPSNIYFVSYLLLLFEVKTQRNEYQLRTMWPQCWQKGCPDSYKEGNCCCIYSSTSLLYQLMMVVCFKWSRVSKFYRHLPQQLSFHNLKQTLKPPNDNRRDMSSTEHDVLEQQPITIHDAPCNNYYVRFAVETAPSGDGVGVGGGRNYKL